MPVNTRRSFLAIVGLGLTAVAATPVLAQTKITLRLGHDQVTAHTYHRTTFIASAWTPVSWPGTFLYPVPPGVPTLTVTTIYQSSRSTRNRG